MLFTIPLISKIKQVGRITGYFMPQHKVKDMEKLPQATILVYTDWIMMIYMKQR